MEIGAKSGWSFQQKHPREVVKTVKNCKTTNKQTSPKHLKDRQHENYYLKIASKCVWVEGIFHDPKPCFQVDFSSELTLSTYIKANNKADKILTSLGKSGEVAWSWLCNDL